MLLCHQALRAPEDGGADPHADADATDAADGTDPADSADPADPADADPGSPPRDVSAETSREQRPLRDDGRSV
jgi:hypothetical protein